MVSRALTFGRRPAALQDLEYSIRQLVEIAVRALSPGINDPFTAGSVVDHLGDALCRIAPRHLPTGAVVRQGRVVLVHPVTDYDGLCDAMFHMIRQNAAGSVHVLGRLLDVVARVAEVERLTNRLEELRRHADLVADAARHNVADPQDLGDILGSSRCRKTGNRRDRRSSAAGIGRVSREAGIAYQFELALSFCDCG